MKDSSDIEKSRMATFLQAMSDRLAVKVEKDIGAIPLGGNYRPDGYVIAKFGKEEVPIIIEVKGHVSNLHQIGQFVDFSRSFDGVCVLVADMIERSIKEHLKKVGIAYYEMTDEMFFPLNLKSSGSTSLHKSKTLTEQQGFRAGSSAKLLLYFVTYPQSMQFTQRELAGRLGMSLSTVNVAFGNLEKMKLISNLNHSKRVLGQFDDVADRWRISYLGDEKAKLHVGYFSPIDDSFFVNWKKINLKETNSYWGGEPAASITTDYLKPGLFTVYTYETKLLELLRSLRLKKDPNGKIEIVKAFWPEEINKKANRTVPDFLVFCDLLNSGIDRNRETAALIKKQLIAKWGKGNE